MRVESFSSGSSGNALFIQSGSTTIMVDCGLGARTMRKLLDERHSSLASLTAVLLTHEHDDHVRGLDTVVAARCAVHGTAGTLQALGIRGDRCGELRPFETTEFESLSVTALPTSHDAAQPCGYAISDGTARVLVLTDLGATEDHHPQWIAASDLIVIESNHDVHMLRSGPYPAHLKRRVQSKLGHLSNADCGASLSEALSDATYGRTVWLAHLSATNNRPDLAVRTVRTALGSRGSAHDVVALPRRECGPVWDSRTPKRPIAGQLSLLGL